MAVADYSTRVVYDDRFDYSQKKQHPGGSTDLRKYIQRTGAQAFFRGSDCRGRSCCPGNFEKKTHNIVSSEIELFNNQPMKEMLSKTLGKTVYIDNESNLCVMSEYMRENIYRNQDNIVYLFADEGLGIGVVANGKLICGSGGYAPEICHMPHRQYADAVSSVLQHGLCGKRSAHYGVCGEIQPLWQQENYFYEEFLKL